MVHEGQERNLGKEEWGVAVVVKRRYSAPEEMVERWVWYWLQVRLGWEGREQGMQVVVEQRGHVKIWLPEVKGW